MDSVGSEPRVRGDNSFELFFCQQLPVLEAVAFGLTGRRALAEELAQEAMLAVYRDWDRVGGLDQPAAFARRIVINKSVSAFRRLGSEARAMARVGWRRQVDSDMELGDDRLWAEVRRLPDGQRRAIVLRYVADLPTDEIADTLECADATVRVLLHRARSTLASALGVEEDS